MVHTTTIINIKELFQIIEKDNRQPVKVLKIGMLYTLITFFSIPEVSAVIV